MLQLQDAEQDAIIAIPYNTDKHERVLNKLVGLYLPSGGAFAMTQSITIIVAKILCS